MPKYYVQGEPMQLDDKAVAPGESVEMTEDDASLHVQLGQLVDAETYERNKASSEKVIADIKAKAKEANKEKAAARKAAQKANAEKGAK